MTLDANHTAQDAVLTTSDKASNDPFKSEDRLALANFGEVQAKYKSDLPDEFPDANVIQISDDTKADVLMDRENLKKIFEGTDKVHDYDTLREDLENCVLGKDSRIFLETVMKNLSNIEGAGPKDFSFMMTNLLKQAYIGSDTKNFLQAHVQVDGDRIEYWAHVARDSNEAITNENNIRAHHETDQVARIFVYDGDKRY